MGFDMMFHRNNLIWRAEPKKKGMILRTIIVILLTVALALPGLLGVGR